MAKKYIDAEKLKAEIIRLRKEQPFHDDASFLAYLHGLSKIEDFLDSLQQEHPSDIAVYLDIMFSNMKRNEAIKQLEHLNKIYGEQSCDTCTNDKGCVTCKDGELWEGKERPSEDLEKAAEKFVCDWAGLSPTERRIAERAYLAGAEWQKQQMIRDCSIQASYEAEIEKAEERGYNLCKEQMMKGNPVVLSHDAFQAIIDDNYNNGRQAMREQMLKDAVEGRTEEVTFNNGEKHNTVYYSIHEGALHSESRIWIPYMGLKDGDKVKIIIVPQKEE